MKPLISIAAIALSAKRLLETEIRPLGWNWYIAGTENSNPSSATDAYLKLNPGELCSRLRLVYLRMRLASRTRVASCCQATDLSSLIGVVRFAQRGTLLPIGIKRMCANPQTLRNLRNRTAAFGKLRERVQRKILTVIARAPMASLLQIKC